MAGINDIIDHISNKYKSEASVIKQEAEKIYSQKMSEYTAKAEEKYASAIEEANSEADKIIDMAALGAKQQSSKAILELKNGAISELLADVKKAVLSMAEDSYDEFLTSILEKNHQGIPGEALLCKNDRQKSLKKFNSSLSKLNIAISDEEAKIEAGFILRYGKCEQNCSIDAILKDKSDALVDYINENLFG